MLARGVGAVVTESGLTVEPPSPGIRARSRRATSVLDALIVSYRGCCASAAGSTALPAHTGRAPSDAVTA